MFKAYIFLKDPPFLKKELCIYIVRHICKIDFAKIVSRFYRGYYVLISKFHVGQNMSSARDFQSQIFMAT